MDNLQYRRFGGDLQGVNCQTGLPPGLGINAIFINPINDAPSLHKYDARYYHHIDVNFGPDPEGDKKLITLENPQTRLLEVDIRRQIIFKNSLRKP